MLKSKKTNRWTEETAEMPKKDIISVECFFLVSLGTAPVSVCVCVCVHHEFTILHIILPLFTRGHQRSDWSSPLFQVLWEEEEEEGGRREGLRTVPTVTASLLPATRTRFSREESRK